MTLKQVFIVNSDLKMGKGKIAGQVAHAEVYYMEELMLYLEGKSPENEKLYERFVKWREDEDGLAKKIILKASEKEITNILFSLASLEVETFAVYDRGLTQISEGSFTCIVVEPLEEEKCDELFGNLRLL